MKKLFLVIATLLCAANVWSAYRVEVGSLFYILDETNKTASVTKPYGKDIKEYYAGEVSIPSSITYDSETYTVTSVGNYAFEGAVNLTSIEIPTTIKRFYDINVFKGCDKLVKVNYLGTIDDWVQISFDFYTSNPTYFSKNLYIKGELVVDAKIESSIINKAVFENCLCIKSVEIGEEVASIDGSAFEGCSNIVSVKWNPKKAPCDTGVAQRFFSDARESIESFVFGDKVEEIPEGLCVGMKKLKEITIPKSVTSIGGVVFVGCSGLTSMIIPDNVTSLGNYSFDECTSLASLVIGDNVKTVVLGDCIGLKSIVVGESVEKINLSGCTSLEKIEWNAINYTEEIRLAKFISKLSSVVFGDKVKHIPASFFSQLNYLNESLNISEITIPESVISIGEDAFYGCENLTKVNYLGTVDKWVEIDFVDEYSNPITVSKFYIKNKLVEEVELTSASRVKNLAFYKCASLKSLKIGDTVESIGENAFYGCTGLNFVEIGSGVQKIEENAFEKSSSINSIVWGARKCECSEPFDSSSPSVKSFVFKEGVEEIPDLLCLFMGGIQEIVIPKSVTSVQSHSFPKDGALRTVVWNAKNCSDISRPLFSRMLLDEEGKMDHVITNKTITSFSFGDEVEYIPTNLCYGIENIEKINVPSSVQTIGEKAFYGCKSLYDVTIGEGVKEIGDSAFYNCVNIEKVTSYPVSVPKVNDGMFNASMINGYHYAILYVPCSSMKEYRKNIVFGKFKIIRCTDGTEQDIVDITEILSDANITISEGKILCEGKELSIYNIKGQDVTSLNGALPAGVYVLQIGEERVKVRM